MAEISLAILGMGRLGTSIGLAIKRHMREGGNHTFSITGYDTVSSQAKTAKQMNAVDEIKNRPQEAVKGKDIVVIAMPYGEVETVYEMIAPNVRDGTVILDLSTLKQAPMKAAEKHLSADVHVVSAAPIVNPKYVFDGLNETEHATEDYFDKGMMMLMPSVKCVQEAVTLATDFSQLLGAVPQFFDTAEHDALIAATELLPSLLGVAYFYTMCHGDGWMDTQRLTNPTFGVLSRPLFDIHPDDLRAMWLGGGSHLIRNINEMILTLTRFRDLIMEKNDDALAVALDNTSKEYQDWINRRHNNKWKNEKILADAPTFSDSMTNLFGNLVNVGRKDKDKQD